MAEEKTENQTTTRSTVIVVHGTFAAPGSKDPNYLTERKTPRGEWYLPGGAFCERLDHIFEKHDAPWRCWVHSGTPFVWSGENSWLERIQAGHDLRTYIQFLIKENWNCAIIAHSHGGNVLLHALEGLTDDEKKKLGPICFIGTPFYDFEYGSSILRTSQFPEYSEQYLWGIIILTILANLYAWDVVWLLNLPEKVALFCVSVFGALAIAFKIKKFSDDNLGGGFLGRPADKPSLGWDMLVINSIEDEAMRFLEFITAQDDPIPHLPTKGSGLFSLLTGSARFAIETDKIRFQSWRTLTGFSHLPLRVLIFVKEIGANLIRSIVGYFFRKRMWRTLQETALGLSGCPLRLSRVKHIPRLWGRDMYPERLGLDDTALQETLNARNASIDMVASFLSSRADKSMGTGLIAHLKNLFTNTELVHAAYYSREKGIQQIATWIEMSHEEKDIRSARKEATLKLDFWKESTAVSKTLAGYNLEDREKDKALIDNLEKREAELLAKLSDAARDAYHMRTANSLHPFALTP